MDNQDNQMPAAWRIGGIVIALAAVAIIAAFLLTGNDGQPSNNATSSENTASQSSQSTDAGDDTASSNSSTGDDDTASSGDSAANAEAKPTTDPAIAEASSPEALFEMGESFYRAEQWDQAIEAYNRAIDLRPDYDAAFTNLGSAHYRNGELDKAVDAYEQALNLSPEDADTHHNLGMVYLQIWLTNTPPNQENLDNALSQINQAIEINPNLPAPYYGLGVVYQVQGEIDQAIEAYEKFLELDDGSDPTATQNATQILNQLKGQ